MKWPAFDSPLLQGFVATFRQRSKAIRYRAGLSCEHEFNDARDCVFERLDLDLRGGQVRLSVWADGLLWLSVCSRGTGAHSGWAFKDSFYGDVLDVSGETLVRMVEATLAVSFGVAPAQERERLRELW